MVMFVGIFDDNKFVDLERNAKMGTTVVHMDAIRLYCLDLFHF